MFVIAILVHVVLFAKGLDDILRGFALAILPVDAAFADPLFVAIADDAVSEIPYVEERGVVTIASGDAPTTVEHDLPNARDAGQQVADVGPVADVPHLEGPIGSGQDLELVVLEASDRARMRREGVQQLASRRVPHPKGRISSGRHEVGMGQAEKADK